MTIDETRELIDKWLEDQEYKDFSEARLKNLFFKYKFAHYNNDFKELAAVLGEIERIYQTGGMDEDS